MKSPTLKNRDLSKISLEEMHNESRNWLSSVAFWKDEVRFMHNLINKNFVYFISKDQKGTLDSLIHKINEIEKEKLDELKAWVVNHERRLSDLLINQSELSRQSFKEAHKNLAKNFELFQSNYRMFKSEVFRLAEEVLKEKDLKKLVS